MCFGGGSAPSAPNLSGQSQASSQIGAQANAAGQNLTNYTTSGAAQQGNYSGTAQNTLASQGNSAFGAGGGASQYFNSSVLPAAQQNLSAAQQWGSPQSVAQAQASAAAGTAQSYNAATQNNMRQLQSYGVDPSTLKGSFANLAGNLSQAGATSTNVYNAGQQRQLQGMALTNQAVGQGASLAGVGQGYTSLGANMTGTGVELGNQTLATGTQAQLAPSQFDTTALAGYGASANINTQAFQNQLAAAQYGNQINTQMMSGIGQGVGMIGGLAADYFSADGGQATRRGFSRAQRFDDGGMPQLPSVGVPTIQIQPPGQPDINTGGAARGQSPGASQQSQSGGNPLSSGFGATGPGSAIGGLFGGSSGGSLGGSGSVVQDIPAGQMASADGGPIKGLPGRSQRGGQRRPPVKGTNSEAVKQMKAAGQRKRQPPGNGEILPQSGQPVQGMAQNPASQSSPGMGDAGAMTFSGGGSVQPGRFGSGNYPPGPNRFDDGGMPQQGNIPQAQTPTSQAPAPPIGIGQGGTSQPVGLTPQQQQAAGQQALMSGAAKGFMETYSFANGGMPPGDAERVYTNALRIPHGIPQPHMQMQHQPAMHVHTGSPHMQQSRMPPPMYMADGGLPYHLPIDRQPSMQRLAHAHAADGGMPGPVWAQGGVADGGSIHGHEPGTFISQGASDGTGIDDQVPARVSVGEYVIPADVVHMKGKQFFDKLVQQYHTPAQQQRQQMGIPHRGAR